MFRHYVSGMIPTKQALLAISITLILSLPFINNLLKNCGYCLSKSLANDCIVLWHLMNCSDYENYLLYILIQPHIIYVYDMWLN